MEKPGWFSFLLLGVFLLTSLAILLFLEKSEVPDVMMPMPIEEFTELHENMQQRMAERTARIKEVCLKEQVAAKTNVMGARKDAFKMVELLEEHRLVMCAVNKAGSSTWNTIAARRYHRDDLIDDGNMYKMQKVLKPNWKTFKDVIDSPRYMKVLLARNPFDRILSAFRNRILPPEGEKSYQAKKYVPLILEYNQGISYSKEDLFHSDGKLKIFPTFNEFVNYLVANNPYNYDPHWKPVSMQCAVCHINYDAVVQTETFTEDLQYIMKLSKLEEEVESGLALRHMNKAAVDTQQLLGTCYSTLRPDVLQRFLQIYHLDFELFKYDPNVIFDYISRNESNQTNVESC